MYKKVGLILLCLNFLTLCTFTNISVIPSVKKSYCLEKPKEEKIYNKLMIIAHPDDDSIFGGEHLLNDDYYVVCVTCGDRSDRLQEFANAMSYTEDDYAYLNHTDLVNIRGVNFISDWSDEKEVIYEELENIINSKDWDLIVTHNPSGEYGHKHHKMINEMVTEIVSDKSKLYYFGIFHNRDEISDEELNTINENKRELLNLYVSQNLNNSSRLAYMFKYENWIKYEEWE